jgi:hypothetical protein
MAAVVILVPGAFGGGVTGAAFTTVNTNTVVSGGDGADFCKNGSGYINCNIYSGKQYVWLNGGPSVAYVGDGSYFFAVLAPGGQHDPLDGSANNLSDTTLAPQTAGLNTDGSTRPSGDTYLNRTFSVSGSTVTYTGHSGETAHDFNHNLIRLMPYDDTTNNGGVYILAICSLKDGYAAVTPSNCKYDAFKIAAGDTTTNEAAGPGVSKDATGEYKLSYTWDAAKSVAAPTTVRQIGGNAIFHYTVTATHSAGTATALKVTGSISATNPNADDVIAHVSDALTGVPAGETSSCTVKQGTTVITATANVTIPQSGTSFSYVCTVSGSTIPTDMRNVVTLSWDEQFLDNGDHLAAGSTSFTYPPITDPALTFTQNGSVDNCAAVTDVFGLSGQIGSSITLGTYCVGNDPAKVEYSGSAISNLSSSYTSPTWTITYDRTIAVPARGCLTYDNLANFTTNTSQATDPDVTSTSNGDNAASVTLCGPGDSGALTMGFWKGPNGQSLITNYGSGLWAWLDGYSPLAAVNNITDVNNVFKAASATNMNNMLKAQMLATALDVYFSGPGWSITPIGSGKNQIKPPSGFLKQNIGAFVMDLTAICPMVDSLSTGTATCKNNTPSTNAVTAGAVPSSPKSVSDILAFASIVDLATPPWDLGAYSTTANVWYLNTTTNAQDRTKQEILKNIFDQINNNIAFAG